MVDVFLKFGFGLLDNMIFWGLKSICGNSKHKGIIYDSIRRKKRKVEKKRENY